MEVEKSGKCGTTKVELITGCVVVLMTNVNNWDLILLVVSQEM